MLVSELVLLAAARAIFGRHTRFLTTNYDTHLERAYDAFRSEQTGFPVPGLKVYVAGVTAPVRVVEPHVPDDSEAGGYIDIVYLHGRLPDTGQGKASWPLVLDERSYASSASRVEEALCASLDDATYALLLGTSLTDIPLIRALSKTASGGCERVAVLLRADFAHSKDEDEQLAIGLATLRASTLRVTPLFPDFPQQVAQLVTEVTGHMAYPVARIDDLATLPYLDRVDRWWHEWFKANGDDVDITDGLRLMLADAYRLVGLEPPHRPNDVPTEQLQVEVWVRQAPVRTNRTLRRWARSSDVSPAGLRGKVAELETASYLAPVRAFVEGRPLRLSIEDLETARRAHDQYTWKSFLSVPVRVQNAVVGVVTLASDHPLATSSLAKNDEVIEELVQTLRAGAELILSV
ncbi:SIR2 family protein [Microbacterium sp. NPDC089180]|uniref:SIR2 family protein n=1 Tax=unclassified Microbacterium TaxID=2609290 RepID=UPI0034205625